MPGNADLKVFQGDDYTVKVMVVNPDQTPADITGYAARAQIRRAVADQDPVVVVEMSADVQSPRVFLGIPHAQTTVMSGRYMWDLQLTSPAGAITTVLAGRVNVKLEVTRNGTS